ncbi:hypothetical protein Mapa_009751 [Marchantia paleacea]|nr:hypothetical protein Mapa_009751 [Marchantia paleacea]
MNDSLPDFGQESVQSPRFDYLSVFVHPIQHFSLSTDWMALSVFGPLPDLSFLERSNHHPSTHPFLLTVGCLFAECSVFFLLVKTWTTFSVSSPFMCLDFAVDVAISSGRDFLICSLLCQIPRDVQNRLLHGLVKFLGKFVA